MVDQSISRSCPVAGRDDRKSAAVARGAGRVERMSVERGFFEARALLRNPAARQAGFLADLVNKVSLTRAPILYQHGAEHRRQRGATARFFAPRVVTTGYRALMEQTSEELVGRLRTAGHANLDDLGLEMAVTIAAEIVGLTDSDRGGMARRLAVGSADTLVDAGSLAWLTRSDATAGSQVTLTATTSSARVLILSGRPIAEPVVFGGPFVMNSQEEIRQAFADYKAGLF